MPPSDTITDVPEESLVEVINAYRDLDSAVKVEVIFQENRKYTVKPYFE